MNGINHSQIGRTHAREARARARSILLTLIYKLSAFALVSVQSVTSCHLNHRYRRAKGGSIATARDFVSLTG